LPTVGVICAGEVGYCGVVVAGVVGDGVGEVSGRVHCAVQYVDYAVTNFLAGQVSCDDGGDVFVVGPRHCVDATKVGDYDGVVAGGCDGGHD